VERPTVFLKAGHDKRFVRGHPWIYANEIRMDADAKALPPGGCVELRRVDGKKLGVGTFNPHSLICFRLFDARPETNLDAAFFARRLESAQNLRQRFFNQPFYRLVHSEGDGLPGLIIDRYGDVIVVQANTAGMDALTEPLVSGIESVLKPSAIVLRNDQRGRALEGLEQDVSVRSGHIDGPVDVEEDDLRFYADVVAGQKTGWFFDQAPNRRAICSVAVGGAVLDLYCHSGGFALQALAGGALRARGIDSSDPALELARRAAERAGVTERVTFDRGEAFAVLDELARSHERYRLVVADPPAFVKSKRELASGLRGYRKLSRLAATVVEPGGFLFIASCSHAVDGGAFAQEVGRGLSQVGRNGRIVRQGGAGPDHPIHPHLPETAYLKSLLIQLD
jgi:23S rRNA (cytosine1962-C5)-methyltransferase